MSESEAKVKESPDSLLGKLDTFMEQSPWHPRVAPLFVYLIGLMIASFLWEPSPVGYVIAYVVMCVATGWIAWRYRRLMPELNFKFDWLAIPFGLVVAAGWMGLAFAMIALFPSMFDEPGDDFFEHMGVPLAWTALTFRLLGMSIIVPIAEELMIRSLLLRALARRKRVWLGTLHFLVDMPFIGDLVLNTKVGRRAAKMTGIFSKEFYRNALGKLTICGVVLSTFIFMLNHAMRDWPGIWFCGIAYCVLVAMTARKGLGPVIWAHGITNACLWGYTIYMHTNGTADWRFL